MPTLGISSEAKAARRLLLTKLAESKKLLNEISNRIEKHLKYDPSTQPPRINHPTPKTKKALDRYSTLVRLEGRMDAPPRWSTLMGGEGTTLYEHMQEIHEDLLWLKEKLESDQREAQMAIDSGVISNGLFQSSKYTKDNVLQKVGELGWLFEQVVKDFSRLKDVVGIVEFV